MQGYVILLRPVRGYNWTITFYLGEVHAYLKAKLYPNDTYLLMIALKFIYFMSIYIFSLN